MLSLKIRLCLYIDRVWRWEMIINTGLELSFFNSIDCFFRFHQDSKIIVYAWVNDEDTKRAYNINTDAYLVFKKMLDRGRPPDDWDELLAAVKGEIERLDNFNLENLMK